MKRYLLAVCSLLVAVVACVQPTVTPVPATPTERVIMPSDPTRLNAVICERICE